MALLANEFADPCPRVRGDIEMGSQFLTDNLNCYTLVPHGSCGGYGAPFLVVAGILSFPLSFSCMKPRRSSDLWLPDILWIKSEYTAQDAVTGSGEQSKPEMKQPFGMAEQLQSGQI